VRSDSILRWLQETREELKRLRQEWSEASANGDGYKRLSDIGDRMFKASVVIETLKWVLEDEDDGVS
jgi:hypothetical protein